MGIFAYGDLVREINGCEFHEVTNQGKSAQPLGQTSPSISRGFSQINADQRSALIHNS
jgi:hypothetical protein